MALLSPLSGIYTKIGFSRMLASEAGRHWASTISSGEIISNLIVILDLGSLTFQHLAASKYYVATHFIV
jgi:hypothetical protein